MRPLTKNSWKKKPTDKIMPYILNTKKDFQLMLKEIGISSIDQLYSQIPSQIKLNTSLNLGDGLSEFEVKKRLKSLALKNSTVDKFNSFLGAGCYDHYIPAALETILSRSEFLTAYTPYQPESSQGILQAIYEYQSFICLLTGMEVTNASLFDGASGLAEAVLMALRISKRKKIILAGAHHPEYIQTLETYLGGFNFILERIKPAQDGLIDLAALKLAVDSDTACCVIQSPNFFGLVENVKEAVDLAKKEKALSIMVTNPLSLAILKEPAALGIDIVCGDGQPFGTNLNFGGPSFGFLATKNEHLRQLPGRIAGKTQDKEGKEAFCLTMQAREQHIRREKATSNICSNHSLNAIGAAIYLSLLGSQGLKMAALSSFNNTQYLYQRLKEIRGVNIPYPSRVFNEFVWEADNAPDIINKLYDKNIIAGYYLGELFPEYKNKILSCCTEKKNKEDIDNFINALAEVLHG